MIPDDPRECPAALTRARTNPLGVPSHCSDAQKLADEEATGPCNREHDNTECRRKVRRVWGWVCHTCGTRMDAADVCWQCKHDECEDCTQTVI